MGEITMFTKVTSKSKSLRTTIPMGIIKQFDLSEGNKLNWEIRAKGGELIVVVRPLEEYHENKKELKNMNKITLEVEQ